MQVLRPKRIARLGSPACLQAGDADPDGDKERQQAGQQAPGVPAAVERAQLAQRPQAQEAQARRAPRGMACRSRRRSNSREIP